MKIGTIGCTEIGLAKGEVDGKKRHVGLTYNFPDGTKQLDVGFVFWHVTLTFYFKRVHKVIKSTPSSCGGF